MLVEPRLEPGAKCDVPAVVEDRIKLDVLRTRPSLTADVEFATLK